MLTQEQLNERHTYLGGTDAAGVLGLSRWSTPLSVWAEKTGVLPPEDISNKLPVKLGSRLEEVVAELFTEQTGKKVYRVNETQFHPAFSFLGANIDRRVVGEDAGLECKTAAAWKRKDWEGEEIPREYIVQCLHYLMVTGKKRWYLAVLIGNTDFVVKTIERDDAVLADMKKREVEFWEKYVVPLVMPQIVTKYDADTLDELYPRATESKEIHLPDGANQLIEVLDSLKQDQRNVEGLIAQKENELKLLLGDAEAGGTSLYRVGWMNSQWSGLDGKALKTEMPEVWTRYYRSKPTRRFHYKRVI